MKTTLSITGYFSLSMIIIGSLFKIQHWPGAGLMLVIGNTLFAFVFLTFFLIFRIKNREDSFDFVEAFALTISMWFLSIGMLFKVQHWPGAGVILIVGLTLISTAFIPMFLFSFYKKKRYSESLNILGIMIGIAALCMVFAINVSKNILSSYVVNNETISSNNEALQNGNKQLYFFANQSLISPEKEKVIRIRAISEEMYNILD